MDFEFNKNPTVDSLDKVPSEFRGMYAEGDGGFQLNESFKGTALAIDGLNKSLKAARHDATEAKRNRPDLSQYAQVGQLLGLDGDEAVNPDVLRSKVEETIQASKDGRVNWEKMKSSLETGFNSKLQAKDGEISQMSKSLQKYLVTTAAVQAISAQKGESTLLLPHIQAQTKVIKDGDDYVVRVVDTSGDPRGNASGGFMTVDDLVKELKSSPVFGRAFESESPNGSGVRPGSTSSSPAPKGRDMTPTQRIAAGLAKRSR